MTNNTLWQAPVERFSERELDILRHVADGYSNREIARELFLSLNTVKWYNQKIYGKLGVESRTQAIARARDQGMLDTEEPPQASGAANLRPQHNLPALITSFVGREQEIVDIKELIQDARLVTLTGPGGIGKTRLAIEAASELVETDAFRDGIYLVDLAPLNDVQRVGDSIGMALGVVGTTDQPVSQVLKTSLEHRNLLLLIDNFEHLLEAVPLVGDLLASVPTLRVLATSREPLGLYGEQEYPVPPLRLPDLSDPNSLLSLAEHEAVTLFLQRAQAVKPRFVISDKDAPAVAKICVRLDGVPLAIELAAAQVKLFRPAVLLSQLDSHFLDLRAGPRDVPEKHQTLRGAIDWSYELLSNSEKTLFARLSVFQGGRTIDAVETVCCHDLPIDVLEGLASLFNKNLLWQEEDPDGEPRFVMLEMIHEYARERLQKSGEAEEIARRHAEYFTTLAERAEPYTRGGPNQLRWLRRLETEHDNLRTAHRWAMNGGDIELGLRMVGALGWFWFRQGHYTEGEEWVKRALEISKNAAPVVRAHLLRVAGMVFYFLLDVSASNRMLADALASYRELEVKSDIAWTLIMLSYGIVIETGEHEQALALYEEGLALLREMDDKPGIALAVSGSGGIAYAQGDMLRAREAYREALDIAHAIGDSLREGFSLINIGLTLQSEGSPAEAQTFMQQSLAIAVQIDHLVLQVNNLAYLAGVSEALGNFELAARLLGTADALYRTHGFKHQPSDLPELERSRANLREKLGEEVYKTLWAEGQAMRLEEAVAYALEEPASDE